jgi:hypothetical protein
MSNPQKKISPEDFGTRYKCYKCGIKFYDLGKPEPLCPSCGTNQKDNELKASYKRKRRPKSFMGKAEPHIFAPEETEDLQEVVTEGDTEYALDVDDIALEEHESTDSE